MISAPIRNIGSSNPWPKGFILSKESVKENKDGNTKEPTLESLFFSGDYLDDIAHQTTDVEKAFISSVVDKELDKWDFGNSPRLPHDQDFWDANPSLGLVYAD